MALVTERLFGRIHRKSSPLVCRGISIAGLFLRGCSSATTVLVVTIRRASIPIICFSERSQRTHWTSSRRAGCTICTVVMNADAGSKKVMDTADYSVMFWLLIAVVVMVLIAISMLNVVDDTLREASEDDERERLNKIVGVGK